jgi:hypothetical protein
MLVEKKTQGDVCAGFASKMFAKYAIKLSNVLFLAKVYIRLNIVSKTKRIGGD